MIELKEDPLRDEVRYLGQLLGGVIEAQEGADFLAFEEEVRKLSKRRRREDVPVATLREMIEKQLTQQDAEDSRDALVKAAYERAFGWVFKRCSQQEVD